MKVIIEGIILSVCLYLSCAWGIRNGAVHMVFLYDKAVQDRVVKLGLTTEADIKKGGKRFKLGGLLFYFGYTMICVFVINGARGFEQSFLQLVAIFWIMGFFDRICIDGLWVGHTKAWVIPGTEDLMPYIPVKVHVKKWLVTLIFYPAVGALVCWLMAMIL